MFNTVTGPETESVAASNDQKQKQLQLPYHVSGHAEAGWQHVFDSFKKLYANGKQSGTAWAVYHKGKLVVDAWGGYMDVVNGRKWEKDTVGCCFSSTKGVSALVVAMLVDSGILSYDDLIVKYWPEFGQHGKEKTTVKMLVSHQAGVPAIDEPITLEMMRDWRWFGDVLANQKPLWPPGTAYGYHALTHGFYIDQLVRRVDEKGRSLAQFIEEQIIKPNDIDWRIGLPLCEWYRMSIGVGSNGSNVLPLSKFPGTFNPPFLSFEGLSHYNHPEWYTVDIAGANGVGTARGLAKLFSLFAEGKLVKSKQLIDQLHCPFNGVNGEKDFFESPFVFESGWGFMHHKSPKSDNYYCIGHGGYGGQMVMVDIKHQLVFACLQNDYTMDIKSKNLSSSIDALEEAVYQKLDSI